MPLAGSTSFHGTFGSAGTSADSPQSPEPLLTQVPAPQGVAYRFGARTVRVHFFAPGELYENPEVPGRMSVLHQRHVVHGGYIKTCEDGEDREGWNLVLVRRPDAEAGEWRIVETDFSVLAGVAPYRPFATQARLFANNLACHWDNTVGAYVLKERPLERGDIVRILGRARRLASSTLPWESTCLDGSRHGRVITT